MSITRVLLSLLFLYTLCIHFAWGQVSQYSGIRTLGRHSYNYAPNSMPKVHLKKSKELRVVYSDRANNKAFTTAYAQHTTSLQGLGTAYYIIGEKNGHYELVLANPKSIGSPKGMFGFLYSSRRHFKDANSVDYVGWMPKNKLLLYNHAFVSESNHRPLRYQVGISKIKRLYDLHRHLKEDSLSVYADPYLKETLTQKVLMGGFVYVYKYDDTGQAALVSDKPDLSAEGRSILGWIPSDMIAYVGQHHAFYKKGSSDTNAIRQELVNLRGEEFDRDSVSFHTQDLQTTLLFTQQSRQRFSSDTTQIKEWAINLPFAVWDHSKNKLINVKGGDIPIRVVEQMACGQTHLNIHLLYFEKDRAEVKRLINSFQTIALKTNPSKHYTYSATLVSGQGNRHLPPTSNFASWLDFLLNETAITRGEERGLSSALQRIVRQTQPESFEDNIIFLLGTTQELDLSTSLLSRLAERSASLVVLQLQNGADEAYQDYLLQGKDLLAQYINRSNDYLANYIVDPNLVKPSIFYDYSREASIYLLDVPHSSLTAGGIVFPPAGGQLSNIALETVIDTLCHHIDVRNELVLQSLMRYKKKLGVLRSQPSSPLIQLHKRSEERSKPITEIYRNAASDTYYEAVWMPDSLLNSNYTEGYFYSPNDVKELIQAYRSLLPLFVNGLGRKELRELRRNYKYERKLINAQNRRKLLTRKASIAKLFYYKTGNWPNDSLLYHLRRCDLRRKRVKANDWEAHYQNYLQKVDKLEELFINNQLPSQRIAGQVYYFISKELLP